MVVIHSHPENCKREKNKATIQVWMMAAKASGDAVLGRHHPPVVPLTGTGIIRTTIGYTIRAALSFARMRSLSMARLNMSARHQTSRMGRGTHVVKLNVYFHSKNLASSTCPC